MDENNSQDPIVKIGKYNVKVVRSLCIGAASCIALSPSVFELDNENKAVVLEGADDSPENVLLAAQSCPTKAVVITDSETGEQIWPK
ncbi:ferredoxin [Patescibacteria group bacterium]|nr:ferredoxin [Patescibacteria group bacterium]